MYALCHELQSFSILDVRTQTAVVQHFVDGITEANVGYLRRVAAPLLYESGVRYRPERARRERQWWDVPAVLAHGYADCKALAAWRAAELIVMGDAARALVIFQGIDREGIANFHALVDRRRGQEDPSEVLGMR